ncbi:MAG: exodeoxyribonuclease 7 small subunit [Candidatus Binatia bacterium]|nr:MAG: exodeoxyribonuclease 7 small subunit [Candidatus Binatia bacterium]
MEHSTLESFEESMRALEDVVRRLERGDLSLEDALAAFEEGIRLVKALNERLTQVEARVEVLTRAPAGEIQLSPLPESVKE